MKKMDWFRILLTGVGGQGVLLASRLLAEAAMKSGISVTAGEIRNMAQRGGAVQASVVLGGARSPMIPRGGADVVLGFEPMEAARASTFISAKTLVIANTHPIVPFTLSVQGRPYPPLSSFFSLISKRAGKLVTLDATAIALEKGGVQGTNMVMLGALSRLSRLPVKEEMLEEVISEISTAALERLNIESFRAGAAA